MNIIRIIQSAFSKQRIVFTAAIILAVAANILAHIFNIRIDLSRNQAYSLSPASKKILKTLKKPLTLTFFVSTDLPTRLVPLKTDVVDLLNEYKKINTKNVQVLVVDPKLDTKAASEIKTLALPELQFSQLDKDKYQVTNAYFGLGLSYEDKKEVIPQLTDISNIEYNITSLIYRMTKTDFEKIGIAGLSDAAFQTGGEYNMIVKVLASQYELAPLTIPTDADTEIDAGYKMVILFDDGKTEYTDTQAKKLETYFNRGGTLILFVNGVEVSDALTTAPAKHNLFATVERMGIKINPDLVLSASSEYVNFGNETFQYFTPYPFWVKTNLFNKQAGLFANVTQLTFPWTSSLQAVKNGAVKTSVLVESSNMSWVQNGSFELNPEKITEPSMNQLKSLPLIMQSQSSHKGQLVVIPASRFVSTKYLSRTSGNIDLVYNIVDNLASSGALSGIRSRTVSFVPIPEIPQNQKDLIKYLNIILLPALLVLCGVIRILRRK